MLNYRLLDESLSIYVHWPFCLSKCPYCDFNSHLLDNVEERVWEEAYLKELRYFESILLGKKVQSIFFGGGTPSLMSPRLVEKIIDNIAKYSIFDQNIEITLEANPTSVETSKFQQFRTAGINRVSVGIQSLTSQGLNFLGRTHSVSAAKNAINVAQSTFSKYSFDLIYCYPNQTLKNWETELNEALSLADGHISLYQLTIEKGTKFFSLSRNGQLKMPNNEVSTLFYETTNACLDKHNFKRYEISNYAKNNQECAHNMNYWKYGNYLGIGPGAHSRLACYHDHAPSEKLVKSIMMTHKPSKWLEQVRQNNRGIQEISNLTSNEIVQEIILMGLRTEQGITDFRLNQLTKQKFTEVLNEKHLQEFLSTKHISFEDDHLKLTKKGLSLHNYIVNALLA